MNFDYSEAEEDENEFAATGAIEFDDIKDGDMAIEIELLAAKVKAARHCGA